MRAYYVYILASRSRVLYVGMTSDLIARIWQHKARAIPGLTSRCTVDRLVHVEVISDPRAAATREREVKAWRREKKVALIESSNPVWADLTAAWGILERWRADPATRADPSSSLRSSSG